MTVKRLVVGMSGASGAIYGIRLLEILNTVPDIETHLVISNAAGRFYITPAGQQLDAIYGPLGSSG